MVSLFGFCGDPQYKTGENKEGGKFCDGWEGYQLGQECGAQFSTQGYRQALLEGHKPGAHKRDFQNSGGR